LKILIDCRFWGPKHTGLGRYSKNLVKNLLAIDQKNQYILFFRHRIIKDFKISQFANVKAVSLKIPHYSLKEQLLLPFLLRKIKPDLVHWPHFNLPFFFGRPYAVTIHDLIKHYSRGMETTSRHPATYFIKYLGYKLVFGRAIKKAKKIIVPSTVIKKQLLGYYPKLRQEKIKVVYEGIEEKFSQAKNKKANFRPCLKVLKKYKISKPYLVYTGNVYPHKNIRRLILAVKIVNNQRPVSAPALNLVIACSRDVFWQRLKKQIAEFKADSFVNLAGFIPDQDLPAVYSQAEAFISPSLMEGFGLPGLEAMAAGCPVVCSKIPVFKEIYGKAACYFNPNDVNSIKAKIQALINWPPAKRREKVRQSLNQVKKYSWQSCAQETLKIYESCLSL